MSLLCCLFDSCYPAGAVVCYSPVIVTDCHTVPNIQSLCLSGKCASSIFSNLRVLRETRSCLVVIPEAVLFCFGNSPVCLEVSLFHAPPAVHFCCPWTQRAVWRVELFLMAPPGTDVIDIDVKLLIFS